MHPPSRTHRPDRSPVGPNRRVAPSEIEPLGNQEFCLPDGTLLNAVKGRLPSEITIGDWLFVDGWPWQVDNVLARPDSGKIIHLYGRKPISCGSNVQVKKFTGIGPPRP